MPSVNDYALFRRGRGRMRHCLYPVDDRARKSLDKVPEGTEVGVRMSHDRSLPMHNRFWAILDIVAKATHWETPDRLLVALKIRLGRYDVCMLPNGKKVPVPQSISFAAMGQSEFERFYQDAMNVLQVEVCPGLDIDQIEIDVERRHAKQAINRMLRDSEKATRASDSAIDSDTHRESS